MLLEVLLSYANAVFFHYPKLLVGAFTPQHTGDLLYCLKDPIFSLILQPKHNDARGFPRWVGTNIGEVGIQRNEYPALLGTSSRDDRILTSSKTLSQHAAHIVSSFGEKIDCFHGQVLVQLEAHASALLGRDAQNPFSCQLCSIADSGLYALRLQRGVAGQDLVGLSSSGEVVENYRDHHPRSPEASLAVADLWIHCNVVLPSHRVHSSAGLKTTNSTISSSIHRCQHESSPQSLTTKPAEVDRPPTKRLEWGAAWGGAAQAPRR